MSSKQQFEEWYYSQYKDNVFQEKPKWPPQFMKFIDSLDVQKLSGAKRMNAFTTIKYNYPLKNVGYACSVFTCSFTYKSKEYETYFAYVYWPIESYKNKMIPDYVCLSPTFVSRDGEFRGDGFILWSDFENGYNHFNKLLSKSEELIGNLVASEQMSINSFIYPSSLQELIGNQIEYNRMLIRLLSVAFTVDGFKYKHNIMQNHTNTDYIELIKLLYESGKDIIDDINSDIYKELAVFHTGRLNRPFRPKCGQKIMPLTLREVTEPMGYEYKIWKEIIANIACTDAVINFISPCFPIYNNWTYIEDIGKGFFEGKFMREKYDLGEKSRLVIDSIKEAKKKIPVGEDKIPTNYLFGQLNIKIYESIEYGESTLLMSNIGLVSTSEYVGYTFGSLPGYIRGIQALTPSIETLFSNKKLFARHMFDVNYSCHVMHTKLGIIHSDLHLNNVTLYESAIAYNVKVTDGKFTHTPKYKNPCIGYILGDMGAHDAFIFPHFGNYMCIIDFSRCLFGGQMFDRIKKERGQLYAENIFDSQLNIMIRLLKAYAPKLVDEHASEIKIMAKTDPDKLFKLVSMTDFITFNRYTYIMVNEEFKKMSQPLGINDVRHCIVAKETVALAKNLWEASLDVFNKHMGMAFGAQKNGDKKESIVDFGGDEIIRRAFAAYVYAEMSEKDISEVELKDMYYYPNELKYTCRDYKQWPKWAQAETLRENLHGLKLTDVLDRGVDPLNKSFEPDTRLNTIVEMERELQETEPDTLTSSMLPY